MTNEEAINMMKMMMPLPRRGDGKSTTHLLQTIAISMAIDALQERKTGKWISDDPFHKKVMLENGQVSCSCHCSECEDWLVASDEYPCRGKYCPNCGAKMEVDE